MAPVSYTNSPLRDLLKPAKKLPLSRGLFNRNSVLRVCSPNSTHRGCRAGTEKTITVRIITQPNYRTHSFDHVNPTTNAENKSAGHDQCANIIVPRLVIS